MVAARRQLDDPNDEAQYGERVMYVITRGDPKSRLVERAVAPEELLKSRHKHLDAAYYIAHMLIPPLERIFNLVGADVQRWYDEMPKTFKVDKMADGTVARPLGESGGKFTIDDHFRSALCVVCGAAASEGNLCELCRAMPERTSHALQSRRRAVEKRLVDAQIVCASCTLSAGWEEVRCESLDCPWLFERFKGARDVEVASGLMEAASAPPAPRGLF